MTDAETGNGKIRIGQCGENMNEWETMGLKEFNWNWARECRMPYALWKRFLTISRDVKGNFTPLAVALVIIILLVTVSVTKFMELWITASGVRDAFEEAMISVVTENYNETYHCVREGYAGGYEPTGYGFYESVDLGDVGGRLGRLLGLTVSGSRLVKLNDHGESDFALSEISAGVINTHLQNGGEVFSAEGMLLLEIPLRFEGRVLFQIPIRLKVKARMREKF
ncbi:MAG: hypothetical protein IKO41_08040 [Lachnospiraceae bacterium]|nr:hypothetical protein [Lachnospiraceae bacterium]